MAEFDPYHRWLQIPPKEQPPNLYRLLGLPLLEQDLDVIENAADQRMSHLRTFQSGKNGALSQKLLTELSQAKLTLLTPDKKVDYDERIQGKIERAKAASRAKAQAAAHAHVQAATDAAEAAKPASIPVNVGPSTKRPGTSRSIGRRPQKSNSWIMPVALVGGGLLILGIVFAVIITSDTSQSTAGPSSKKTGSAKKQDASNKSDGRNQKKPKQKPRPWPKQDSNLLPKTNPNTQPEQLPKPNPELNPDTKPLVPETETKPLPNPAPFISLESVLPLPELNAENALAPAKIGIVNLNPGELFAVDILGGDYAYRNNAKYVVKELAADKDRLFQVALVPNITLDSPPITIAELRVKESDLIFQWNESAQETTGAGNFRNCLLSFKTESTTTTVGLRHPVKMEGLQLDDRLSAKSNVTITDLPDEASVKIELLEPGKGYPPMQFSAGNTITLEKGKAEILFGDRKNQFLAGALVANGKEKLSLTLFTKVIFGDGTFQSFTGERKYGSLLQQLTVSLPAMKKRIPGLEKRATELEKTAIELKEKPVLAREVRQQVALLRKQLAVGEVNKIRVEGLMQHLQALQTLPIPIRIYLDAETHQVDLATSTGGPVLLESELGRDK